MLAQKLILGYSTRIFLQFLQVAASIVVARVAGPTVLGTIAFGLAYVSMFLFIADLGIGTAHIKLVSEGRDLGKCITTYAVIKCSYTCLFTLVLLGTFFFQKTILHYQFESSTHEHVIFIMLAAVLIEQLLYVPKTTFAARTEQAKQSIPEIVKSIPYQFLRITVVLLGYGAVALALGNLVSTLLTIPVFIYLFRGYKFGNFDKELAKEYIMMSLPIILLGMSTKLIASLDKVLLQYFTNSTCLGYYSAGFRVGGFILLIANTVSMLFFPLFSEAAGRGDFKFIKKKITKFERFSFLFIMPGVILVAIFSDTIIKILLGAQYMPSVNIMSIITIAMFLMVINMPYGNVITGMGDFKLASIINVLTLLFFLVAIFFLSSPNTANLGATGTAIAVLLSNAFIGILFRVFAKKKCPILSNKYGLKFSLYGVASFCLFKVAYSSHFVIFLWQKLLFAVTFIVVTYLSFYLMKWIKKDDWNNLLSLFNFRAMTKYVKSEVRGA